MVWYCQHDTATGWHRARCSRVSNGESAATRPQDGLMQQCPCVCSRMRVKQGSATPPCTRSCRSSALATASSRPGTLSSTTTALRGVGKIKLVGDFRDTANVRGDAPDRTASRATSLPSTKSANVTGIDSSVDGSHGQAASPRQEIQPGREQPGGVRVPSRKCPGAVPQDQQTPTLPLPLGDRTAARPCLDRFIIRRHSDAWATPCTHVPFT